MMLRKLTESMIFGIFSLVKANISLGRPGTAAEMVFSGPIADLIAFNSSGYASISHSFSSFGVVL